MFHSHISAIIIMFARICESPAALPTLLLPRAELYVHLHVKYPILLYDFNQNSCMSTNYSKLKLQNIIFG